MLERKKKALSEIRKSISLSVSPGGRKRSNGSEKEWTGNGGYNDDELVKEIC